MRDGWRRRGEGTAGGTWGRSFISSWRIWGNLCISSGARQACKSNEGYGFLRSRTTTRSRGCFGGNHKLLGWLTLRLALGEEKGKKQELLCMFLIMAAAPVICICTCGRKAGQAAQQKAAVLLSLVGFHVTLWHSAASLGSFVWRCCFFPRASWLEILIFKSHRRILCSHQTHKPPNSWRRSSKEPKDERDRRNSSQWSQLKWISM